MVKSSAEERSGVEERLRRDIEIILRIFRDRLTHVGGKDVKIVDGDGETRAVLESIAGIDRSLPHNITVLRRPKGCGRTALFDSLAESIHIADRKKIPELFSTL